MATECRSKGRTIGLILGWLVLIISIILFALAILDIWTSDESITHPVIVFLGEFVSTFDDTTLYSN